MPESIAGYRLSPQQKRRWRLQREGLAGRSSYTLLIEGSLRLEILQKSLQALVHRHEIFRTAFTRSPGIPLPIQVIETAGRLNWRIFDWSAAGEREQRARLARLLDETDLISSETVRDDGAIGATLVTLAASRHLLHLDFLSLSVDSWTFKILTRELADAYAIGGEGREPSGEAVQYLQFSEWQNELLEDENAALGFAFWRKQDAGTAPLSLPFKRRREVEHEINPASVFIDLDAARTAELDALARRCGVQTEIVWLACWQILLWRMTGQENMTLGYVIAGRKFEELQEACGLFAKALPAPSRVAADKKFGQLVQQINETARDAQEWQEWFIWPEDQRQASEEKVGSLPIGFEFAEWSGPVTADGVTFTPYAERVIVERFDLKLRIVRRSEAAFMAELSYDPCSFDAADIERLAANFNALLLNVVKNPEALVGDLETITDDERRRFLDHFNFTNAEDSGDRVTHRMFEEQVLRTPDSVAIIFDDQQVTYEEVNTRSNQLAHYLKTLGVGPEVLVGICCERSPEMLTAILGVHKAGGAYLPLDSYSPPDRLAYMLEDARVPVLLVQEHLVERLPAFETRVVCLDSDWDEIVGQKDENPITGVHPENPAYVIYTSGSTGRPKGVVIPHRGLVNYLSWCSQAYAVVEGEGAAVHSPLGFDLTVTSLLAPLMVGRAVELAPESQGIEGLSAVLERRRNLSLLKLTPSHLEMLSHLVQPEVVAKSAKAFVIGGEALLAEHLRPWQERAPGIRLFNEYGPTEAVVGCCIHEVTEKAGTNGAAIPIGRPIANAKIFVLDHGLKPAPTYAPGELYIGGLGLARGYLNRPDMTAEKFIPDPFSAVPDARLYRTGDVARHLPEGNLEYLGRNDSQVKIRGFRVELSEIEIVLSQHPDIREAAVAVREDLPGDSRLVAYIVPERDPAPGGKVLRHYLVGKLPEYMTPSVFIMLDSMPLSINGKLDRRALPAPDVLRPKLEAVYTAPETETEMAIAAIWREVLRVERVGVDDNFFDLGGHSLLLVRVSRKLQETFNREVPVLDLFKYPTISSLVQRLSDGGNHETPPQMEQDRAQLRHLASASQREQRGKRSAARDQREAQNG
jgi:amino acid adenylation domain-containing protein